MRTFLLYLLVVFYFIAGVNHFINPQFYLWLIPDYLPYHNLINLFSGVIECVLALAVAFPKTRKLAAVGIIIMLMAFIPAHVHHIQSVKCTADVLCMEALLAWLRIVVIHPLLLWWAYWVGFRMK